MAVAMLSTCVISSRSLPPVAVLSYKERFIAPSVLRVVQRPRRFERCIARAKKSEVEVILKPQSQWTVSPPLALASVEVVYLAAWIVSVRSLIPSLIFFQGAADVVLSGIMTANCIVGWYALERSRSEIDAPAAAPGLMDIAFSLALSFIPLANLFMWLKFAITQKDLPAKAKASLVANALIYEAPRLVGVLFLFSGGLAVLLGIESAAKLASLLSALHRPMAEARVKNESRITQSQQIMSPVEKERLARLKELEEFDRLLALRSSSSPVEAKEWSVEETMEWLEEQGYGRYANTFGENDIDGELLLQLTNDDLRDELQISSFGDRKKLEILIQQLKRR